MEGLASVLRTLITQRTFLLVEFPIMDTSDESDEGYQPCKIIFLLCRGVAESHVLS